MDSISPDGKWVAILSVNHQDTTFYLWPVGGKDMKPFSGHRNYITSVSFSPDSKWVATGSRDRTARVWSLESDQVYVINYVNPVEKVAFSPEGSRLASATGPSVRVAFAATGQAKALLEEAKSPSITDKKTGQAEKKEHRQ